jgi:hypothetical protein
MKKSALYLLLLLTTLTGCGRAIRTAKDVTPGNPVETQMDWRYGAADIRIQTSKINKVLMNRWYARTGYQSQDGIKPRIIITEIENKTDTYISTDMIRDIIESNAVEDGRYSILVGNTANEQELDALMHKISTNPKYSTSSRPKKGQALAPQFLAKIRLTKAQTATKRYDIEDYRMSVNLYDMETQELIDSAWDVLKKQVKH